MFNKAVDLANRGEHEKAAELFEQIAHTTSRPNVQAQAAHHASQLRKMAAHNRHIDQYNQAVSFHNGGDLAAAESLMLELLADDPEDELRRKAEELLRTIRRRRASEERSGR